MADSTAPQRVAENMRGMSIEAITRQLNDRITRAHMMSDGAQAASMDFNARLITALREAELWPNRPMQKSSSFP